MDFKKRAILAPDVLFRAFQAEAILLNLRTGRYYELDDIGTSMWQNMTRSETIQGVYEAMLDEYEVEPAQLKGDMIDLLTQLLENHLIVLQDR